MNNSEKIPLIVVCGATASGKTALGIALAEQFNGEIVSADSMQIYQEMSIATAKPSKEEMRGIRHHMLDFLPPDRNYSVADYVKEARATISDIYSRNKIPLLVGGTGLYIQSVTENISFSEESYDETIRKVLKERLVNEGTDALLQELAEFDKPSAERIGTSNPRRLIRAIEIYRTSGKTMTECLLDSKKEPSPYNTVKIGLTTKDRQKLYDRINERVDSMVKSGLLEETEQYLQKGYTSTSAKAIGYKELEPYFQGNISLEQALENLKQATRRYAKRQLTWFRRDKEIQWIYTDIIEKEEVIQKAVEIVKKSGILFKGVALKNPI